MLSKVVLLLFLLVICVGLNNCKSPAEPEPNYWYRYNVEVIYTRPAAVYPNNSDSVELDYILLDPAILEWRETGTDSGSIRMDKIAENKFRCYLPKVFIQTSRNPQKHSLGVRDRRAGSGQRGENIDIQGAYEWEIWKIEYDTISDTRLRFKQR